MASYSWERPKDDNWQGQPVSAGYGFAIVTSTVAGLLIFGLMIFSLEKISFLLGIAEPIEIRTKAVKVSQVEISAEPLPEEVKEELIPPEPSAQDLLTEVEELIPELDNTELDISPEIEKPEVALEASVPLESGEEFGELMEPVAAPEVSHVLDQIGRTENLFTEAATGQIVVEEGSVKTDVIDPDEYLKDMAKKGSGGLSDEGLPSGYASIDGLLRMASSELTRNRAALPSDLLFEYDSAALKETARFGLMKLAMLIDRNPELYCILEGHTDLFGADAYNKDLSQRRASAVKSWLVESMKLSGDRIVVIGYGKSKPKVTQGSIEEQSLNRRVDILMRKELPEELKNPARPKPVERKPIEAVPVEEEVESVPPQEEAEPLPAVPVEEDEVTPLEIPDANERESQPLEAIPVEE